jgi:adenine-specific DNA-methyltransferase
MREGLVTFKKTTTGPLVDSNGNQAHWNIYIKKYLGDAMGAPSTLVPKENMSIYNVGTQCVQALFDGIRVFENAKPVNVIQYFINMVAQDGDIVMDFFSGTATTAHAVMQTQVDKNIKLNYILVQVPEKCGESSDAFKSGYGTICEIGKERIRRAAKKIREDNPGAKGDFGFRVFAVDDSNMTDVYYSPAEYSQSLLSMLESNVKPDRSALDLLFGCLLEWGLPLSLPYSSEQLDGCTVHNYNDGDLIACFDENVPDSVIKEIAKRQPLRAVFRDSSFANSSSKINVGEIFKLIAPDTRVKVI